MSFVWPEALWLLLTVPVLVLLYVRLLRRRRRVAMRREHGGNRQNAGNGVHGVLRRLPDGFE